MWCIFERRWCEFNSLFKLPELGTEGCSGIETSLINCEDLICKTCSTTTGTVDLFPNYITIDRDEFEIVSEFCYLVDAICQAGICSDAVTARIGSAWKASHELLPNTPVSEVFFCMEVNPGPCLLR